MVQTIAADKVTLYDLEQRFGLRQTIDPAFFAEWQDRLPDLTEGELHRLARVKASMANLEQRSILENTVKLAVVAPLLDLSGFFLPPFYVSTEDAIAIEASDKSVTVRGRIDVLVLQDQLWVLVIESKRAEFSIKVGIPQALAYMLANPNHNQNNYGLVTNGTDFVFLKLNRLDGNLFGRSHQFILGQDDDLERVLQIMKRLAQLMETPPSA
ncbi:MAG: type I restriction endonuclease [Cyanobacteria bacterium P01_F01_bin.150]